MEEGTPSLALLMNAGAFLRAAETLHESDPAGWGWTATYVNTGFALELALKAFLAEHGASDTLLKRLGHNLVATYEEAIRRGYRTFDESQARLVWDLSPSFQDMSVRYGTCGWIELPAVKIALQVARRLVEDVWGQCCFLPENRRPMERSVGSDRSKVDHPE